MNAVKQYLHDIVDGLPDDIDKIEGYNQILLRVRLEESIADVEKNGSIPHDEFKKKMDARRKKLVEGS